MECSKQATLILASLLEELEVQDLHGELVIPPNW